MNNLEILLYALDLKLAYAWRREFDDCPHVRVVEGSILETEADAIVSPANSFGFMDGGLDLKLSERFGWDVERRVRDVILRDYDGELPVGNAVVVRTDDPKVPWLISAPTMRVPMDVSKTANAHLAFRAILRALRDRDEPIRSVACSGLGTGEGRMSPEVCARQMRFAYSVVAQERPLTKGGLAGAVRNHMELLGLDTSGL